MIRKFGLLALGLAASLGCDSGNPDPNNNLPQTGKQVAPPGAAKNSIKGEPAPIPDSYPKGGPAPNKSSDKKDDGASKTPDAADKDKDKAKDAADDKDKSKDAPAEKGKDADSKTAAAGVTLSEEEITKIKTLPEADQKLALEQKICPVGEEEDGKPTHLGSMDAPYKVVVEGKTIFLCCKGCEKDLKKDPKAALAKLNK